MKDRGRFLGPQTCGVGANFQIAGTQSTRGGSASVFLGELAPCLIDGDNLLHIEPPAGGKSASDDIRVGEIEIANCPVREALREATLDVIVFDGYAKHPLPCRITVLNERGAMQTLGAESNDHLAVRPGMVFTSTGRATLGVPAGRYTIFAGRGFEYSLTRAEVTVAAGQTLTKSIAIGREVPTKGYVACDTHVHTLTHSGHGDATIEERMITLAGEGIELPIATDHNQHIDYEETATRMGVRRYFTPVVGNEVTTARGYKAREFKLDDFRSKIEKQMHDRAP